MLNNANPAWNRFGAIVLLTSTNTKKRLERTIPELHRVGITDFSTYTDTPSPFLDRLYFNYRHNFAPWCRNHITSVRVSFAHYKAVSSAYYDNADSALIIEDDIRFLKDVSAVAEAVKSLPPDFTFALFDHGMSGRDDGERKYMEYFGPPKNGEARPAHEWKHLAFHVNYATAYAMSRQGMKLFLDFYDRPKHKTHHNDFYQSPEFYPRQTSFLSAPPIAIQDISTGTPTNTPLQNLSKYHDKRQRVFGNLADYNLS